MWISRKRLKIETPFQVRWNRFLKAYKPDLTYPICDLLSGHQGQKSPKSELNFCQNVDISKTNKDRNSIPSALEPVSEGLQIESNISHMWPTFWTLGSKKSKSELNVCQNVDISKTAKDRNSISSMLEPVSEGLQIVSNISHMWPTFWTLGSKKSKKRIKFLSKCGYLENG
jgi:hypothetical protein